MCNYVDTWSSLWKKKNVKFEKIPNQRSTSLLVIEKNVSRLGQQSSPLGLATIHSCKPYQWARMAHQGLFICSSHNKWPSQATYNYDWHKQVSFPLSMSFFSHKRQTKPCWCLTFFFSCRCWEFKLN